MSGSAPTSHRRHEHVGLGSDWLVYAAAPGSFPMTEMLAPGLVLGTRSTGLLLRMESGPQHQGPAWLHAAGIRDEGEAAAIVVLYLDPLSEEGAMVQAGALKHGGVMRWEPGDDAGDALLKLCVGAGLTGPGLAQWVGELRGRLRRTLPALPAPDARMLDVARALAQRPEGRPDVEALARVHGLSADHLRQTFRRVAGMTLSRYHMWRRVCAMVDHACQAARTPARAGAQAAIHAAGFYDLPHGTRALRRYFGLTPQRAVGRDIEFVDGRTAVDRDAWLSSRTPP